MDTVDIYLGIQEINARLQSMHSTLLLKSTVDVTKRLPKLMSHTIKLDASSNRSSSHAPHEPLSDASSTAPTCE